MKKCIHFTKFPTRQFIQNNKSRKNLSISSETHIITIFQRRRYEPFPPFIQSFKLTPSGRSTQHSTESVSRFRSFSFFVSCGLLNEVILTPPSSIDVVIFTRFVGPNEKPYIFRPSLNKKFGIFTQGGPNSPFANKIKEALDSGYIGVGVFHHNGQKLELKLKPVLDDAPNHKKGTSTLELRALPTDIPHTDGEDGLGKILEMGVREEDSMIRFGVKELDREEGSNGRIFAYFGFNFVEMKLSCFNPVGHQGAIYFLF